jgi:hypothetical protein
MEAGTSWREQTARFEPASVSDLAATRMPFGRGNWFWSGASHVAADPTLPTSDSDLPW